MYIQITSRSPFLGRDSMRSVAAGVEFLSSLSAQHRACSCTKANNEQLLWFDWSVGACVCLCVCLFVCV